MNDLKKTTQRKLLNIWLDYLMLAKIDKKVKNLLIQLREMNIKKIYDLLIQLKTYYSRLQFKKVLEAIDRSIEIIIIYQLNIII